MKTPKDHYDFSHGSNKVYLISARHAVLRRCLQCGKIPFTVILDSIQYFNYFLRGMRVQDAFPNLTAEERDMLSVGIHPECSDAFYGIPEETGE